MKWPASDSGAPPAVGAPTFVLHLCRNLSYNNLLMSARRTSPFPYYWFWSFSPTG